MRRRHHGCRLRRTGPDGNGGSRVAAITAWGSGIRHLETSHADGWAVRTPRGPRTLANTEARSHAGSCGRPNSEPTESVKA